MAAKDYELSLNGKSKTFNNNAFSNQDNSQQQYSNLNLNAVHQNSAAKIDDPLQSKSISFKNDERKVDVYKHFPETATPFVVLDYNNSKNKNDTNLWSKNEESQQNSMNFLNGGEEKFGNQWKKKDVTNDSTKKNSSTLSLHIAAYENSVETATNGIDKEEDSSEKQLSKASKKKGTEKVLKNVKQITSTFMLSPFEIPRQQADQISDPEVMQFKASQKMINPNATGSSNNGQQDGKSKDPHDDKKEWKKKAKEILKYYYLALGKREYDGYNPETDLPLLRAKICYAIFGPPENNADTIQDAYSDDQKKEAQKIVDVIVKAHRNANVTELSVGIIFVCCKQDEKELCLPIFRVQASSSSKYVDIQCRIYDDWSDWKKNNCLPEMKYCYPKNGYFSCSDYGYKYSELLDPVIEYGTSPACNFLSRIAKKTDIVAFVGGFGAGLLGIGAAIFPPLGFIAAPVFYFGSASAVYGFGRAADRLIDKGKHGESLIDFESATLWLSVFAAPLNFVSSYANANLAAGAARGRIFSSTTRILATTLNCTTLGVDGVMLGFGFANLIEKYHQKELNNLDILQFSMSVFFFSHTLMQPITAKAVIKNAQNQQIKKYADHMTDADAQASFKKFLDRNRGDMKADSKVIRSLNRMNDPNAFFKGVGKKATVDGVSRKGKAFLVTDVNGRTSRINPNRMTFTEPAPPKPIENLQNLQKSLGGKTLDEYTLNGKKVFKNLDDRTKGRINSTFNAAKYNKEIIDTAIILAKDLLVNDADRFMSVIEIVAADVKGLKGADLTKRLGHLQSDKKISFLHGIKKDLILASQIAQKEKLSFSDPYKAVYHYRKHGKDFPTKIQSIDFYLGDVANKIIRDEYCVSTCTFNLRNCIIDYCNYKLIEFAVVVETPRKQTICTMFRRAGSWKAYVAKMKELHKNAKSFIPAANDAATILANALGMGINLSVNEQPLSDVINLDPEVHKQIAEILAALSSSNDDSASDDDDDGTSDDDKSSDSEESSTSGDDASDSDESDEDKSSTSDDDF